MAKADYKSIAIQAGITAVVVAVVNKLMTPVVGGLGAGDKLMLQNFSIERMAQFADAITIANVNNLDYLREQFGMLDVTDPMTFKNGNRTSIGNCAYVAIYSKHKEARDLAHQFINNYKKYADEG